MVTSRWRRHEPTTACVPGYPEGTGDDPFGRHCWSCHRDQPAKGYRLCFECGHFYRTRAHLFFARWRMAWQIRPGTGSRAPDPAWEATWWQWFRALFVRPAHIYYCQCCSHDF